MPVVRRLQSLWRIAGNVYEKNTIGSNYFLIADCNAWSHKIDSGGQTSLIIAQKVNIAGLDDPRRT